MKTEIVEFNRDSSARLTYTATINNSDEFDYYVSAEILKSLKDSGKFTLLVKNQNNNVVFRFTGTHMSGKFVKFYSSGQRLALGKIKNGKPFGCYKEFEKNGSLILKCTYFNDKIVTKRKSFFRRKGQEILCDKKWFKKVQYDQCVFFSNTPKFLRLLKPTDDIDRAN